MPFMNGEFGLDPSAQGQGEIIKALQVGQPGIAPGNGGSLVPQDLSPTITTLTNTMDDIVFYKSLPQTQAQSMVYEYNVRNSYGSNSPNSVFMQEVDVPLDDSASYTKGILPLKYIGKRGYVSDAARLVNAIVDLETEAVMNTSMATIRDIESLLYNGNSALNPMAFDGLETQILAKSPASNILDAHGGDLTFDMTSNLAAVLTDTPNFAHPTTLHMNKSVRSVYTRSFYPTARMGLADPNARTVNFQFAGQKDDQAEFDYVGSAFINTGATGNINPNQDFTQSPSAPTFTAPANAPAGAGQVSSFLASDAGQYLYWVQAENKFGRSALVPVNTTPLSVNAGDVVTFTVTMGGSVKPDFFIIYRTDKTGAAKTRGEIARVGNVIGAQGPAAVSVIDGNAKMPGTTNAYLLEYREEVISWVRLLSLAKIDLAKVRTAKEYYVYAIGALLIKAPTKVGMIKNIRKPSFGA